MSLAYQSLIRRYWEEQVVNAITPDTHRPHHSPHSTQLPPTHYSAVPVAYTWCWLHYSHQQCAGFCLQGGTNQSVRLCVCMHMNIPQIVSVIGLHNSCYSQGPYPGAESSKVQNKSQHSTTDPQRATTLQGASMGVDPLYHFVI